MLVQKMSRKNGLPNEQKEWMSPGTERLHAGRVEAA